MKSSTGNYYIGLDHIRGLAAFMVFTWHFIHIYNGHKSGPSLFPFNILTEGHTGVAVFMVLSGYLFSKILDKQEIIYSKFFWNRLIRLLPLLFIVICLVGLERILIGKDLTPLFNSVISGVLKPSLPNGGWSITIEFHFYILLPLLFFLNRKWKYSLIIFLVAIIILRLIIYLKLGQIQYLSYWTIIGRIDQFLLGIMAFKFRAYIKNKNFIALVILVLFLIFYYYFDSKGGFFMFSEYPSPSPIWIIIPTIEGCSYAFLISWYDNSFKHSNSWVSRIIASAGNYSYSIYLLHFFIVFRMAAFVDKNIVELSNIYVAIFFSFLCFLFMIPIGYLSFRFIEAPFLKFRKIYLKKTKTH